MRHRLVDPRTTGVALWLHCGFPLSNPVTNIGTLGVRRPKTRASRSAHAGRTSAGSLQTSNTLRRSSIDECVPPVETCLAANEAAPIDLG